MIFEFFLEFLEIIWEFLANTKKKRKTNVGKITMACLLNMSLAKNQKLKNYIKVVCWQTCFKDKKKIEHF